MSTPYPDLLWANTRIQSNLDFVSPGKRTGDLRLKHSDNEIALGYIPIPAGVIINGDGPTVILTGGVHGDEFEGPISLIKFLRDTNVNDIQGRVIVIPALNAPAVNAAARVSPLDDGNLNRAFPGDRDGTPTQQIANFIESTVMPVCDYAIDLHAGGKAYWFSPCAMATYDDDPDRYNTIMKLAEVFGCPLVWVMGIFNDDRSVNGAAVRNEIPSIAAELGGGGHVTPETLQLGEQGIRNCLRHIGVLNGDVKPNQSRPTFVKITDAKQHVYTTHRGLFEPAFAPGDRVQAGDPVGYIHSLDHIDSPPVLIEFPFDGVAFVRCQRGLVAKGEALAVLGVDVEQPSDEFEGGLY